MLRTTLRRAIPVASLLLAASLTIFAQSAPYDLVINGGRVIDPESGLDAIRHLGIRGDRIAEISTAPLTGLDTLDATGLVVTPGFIDVHRHAHGDNSYRFAARDGVTSTFELEIGAPDVDAWYRMMGPSRLINFGVGAGHLGARMQVLGDKGFMLPTGPGRGPATAAQMADIERLVERGLADGGVAVGIATPYAPGTSLEEVAVMVSLAARHKTLVIAHLAGRLVGLQRALDMAGRVSAAIHVAHVNSTAGDDVQKWLETIREARAKGLDVTTEMYPYTAGATMI